MQCDETPAVVQACVPNQLDHSLDNELDRIVIIPFGLDEAFDHEPTDEEIEELKRQLAIE
jgi:hypothetical protein